MPIFHSCVPMLQSWNIFNMMRRQSNYDINKKKHKETEMENNEIVVASEQVVEPVEQPKIDVKAFKVSADAIAKQLGQCMICNTPIIDEYTLMYQKIAGQPIAIAVLCNDCCMLRLAKPRKQEASNEN